MFVRGGFSNDVIRMLCISLVVIGCWFIGIILYLGGKRDIFVRGIEFCWGYY